jgi:Zn-dependent peptidase ImmA (M78 family)
MVPMLPPGKVFECEEIALEARGDIGLQAEHRLDPEALAEHLAIDLRSLIAYASDLPEEVSHLTEEARSAFSAVTVYRERKRMIVFNPAHSPRRHVNTIAHELAHVLLEHQPTQLFDANGQRVWIASDEVEADYLAGALLVPRSAVRPVMDRMGGNLVDAAEHFGVSENLMHHRVEVCLEPVQVEIDELDRLVAGGAEPVPRLGPVGGQGPAPVSPPPA